MPKRSLISPETAQEISQAYAKGERTKSIAAKYKLSTTTIIKVVVSQGRGLLRGKKARGRPVKPRVFIDWNILKSLVDQKLTIREISKRMNLSIGMIEYEMRMTGLKSLSGCSKEKPAIIQSDEMFYWQRDPSAPSPYEFVRNDDSETLDSEKLGKPTSFGIKHLAVIFDHRRSDLQYHGSNYNE